MSRTIGVSGASGYIGRAIIRAAIARGWKVIAIGRRPVEGTDGWREADLRRAPPEATTAGLDALLHLAADTHGNGVGADEEQRFAEALVAQARASGTCFVFASSQAASSQAPSDYGRIKLAIERSVCSLGGISVRPGLVVGGREAGLFGLLVSLVRVSPLVPKLLPRPLVQPIHVDDLASVLLDASDRPELAGRVLCAAGDPIWFDELLMGIARHRVRRRRLLIPVPTALVRGLLALATPIAGPRLSPARLDSLVRLPPLASEADLAELGVALRPVEQALDRRGQGLRALLVEGQKLAQALMGQRPPALLSRRYARLLSLNGGFNALPHIAELGPVRIAALDTLRRRKGVQAAGSLAWRMNVAMRLAEAEPRYASRFLVMPAHAGFLRAMRDIVQSVASELLLRLIALCNRRRFGRLP